MTIVKGTGSGASGSFKVNNAAFTVASNHKKVIPTGAIGIPGRLSWSQLRHMQATGRWQIDEHAGDGHVAVTIDSAGRQGPFYANEIWANGAKESFRHYKRRVSRDVRLGLRMLARHIPGWSSHGTFAVPFNNYGQHGSNDPRIAPWLGKFLKARFAAVLLQDGDGFSTPGPGIENRIEVPGGWGPLEPRGASARRPGGPDGSALSLTPTGELVC